MDILPKKIPEIKIGGYDFDHAGFARLGLSLSMALVGPTIPEDRVPHLNPHMDLREAHSLTEGLTGVQWLLR
jgi:hypothetical protein